MVVAKEDAVEKDAVNKARNPWERTPTPIPVARWKEIPRARLKGPSLRSVARELGMVRDTMRKYAYAEKPPTKKLSAPERAKLKALGKSATVANSPKGHFRFPFDRAESLDNNKSAGLLAYSPRKTTACAMLGADTWASWMPSTGTRRVARRRPHRRSPIAVRAALA